MNTTTDSITDGGPKQAEDRTTPEGRAAIVAARIAKTAAQDASRLATIRNRGFGLPSVGDTVLLDGEGIADAYFIRRIVTTDSPSRAHDGTLWQRSMTCEGSVLRCVAVEDCVSEYVATARLLPMEGAAK